MCLYDDENIASVANADSLLKILLTVNYIIMHSAHLDIGNFIYFVPLQHGMATHNQIGTESRSRRTYAVAHHTHY